MLLVLNLNGGVKSREESEIHLSASLQVCLHGFVEADIRYQTFRSSVQFTRSVMSNSLWPHELQHARPPCPPPTSGVHSDPRPSSQWCHPAISSSVVPFSSCPQSLPASESCPMSQLFAWDGQSTGASKKTKRILMDNRTVFNGTKNVLGASTFMISDGTMLAFVLVHAKNAKEVT